MWPFKRKVRQRRLEVRKNIPTQRSDHVQLRAVEEAGIESVIECTGDAAGRFNALAKKDRRVAGAFHLTC